MVGSRGLFVPLDANYQDNPKILGAGADAELVYVRSLALAKRLTERDGHIHRAHLRRLTDGLDNVEQGNCTSDDVAKALIDSGLWLEDTEGWTIAGWLDSNPSAAEIDAARGSEATRKAAWRKSKRTPPDDPPDDPGRDEVSQGTERDATPSNREVRDTEKSELEGNQSVELVLVDAPPPATDPVAAIFDAWRETTGHHKAVLDKKRRSAIVKARQHYSDEDLIDACRGVHLSPHHRGENDRNTVYDDIALVLRDAEHIERFRDLARGQTNAPPRLPQNAEMVRRAVARAGGKP